MFARIKKSGRYEYLQIVENRKVQGKVNQRVIATVGRLDQLQAKGGVEPLVRSLARFSEKTLLVLSGKGEANAHAVRIGPAIIFERLWRELGLPRVIRKLLEARKFEFDVERAIFLTVLHRLFVSGSDRSCDRWRHDYAIAGEEDIALHHVYRAMAFLGEELADQSGATPFAPRCTKDLVEEGLFRLHRNLFTGLDLVFFDTTSIYFEGEGGETLGRFGHSKDHRPDRKQMVVGAILDDSGRPICCEMWPGNTADVKSLLPVVERLQTRFHIQRFCIVADRGMISAGTIEALEKSDCNIPYILGARMRRVKEVSQQVLSRAGRYHEVHPEGTLAKDPSPLAVKEVMVEGRRYVVCRNSRQARKDAAARESMVADLEERIRRNPKALVGNRGYARYLKISKGGMTIDRKKIEEEASFDGKWVLRTNMTELSAEQVALKYKELWQVEQVFRDVKSILDTRPIFHKRDETIRGHVFCSFLALVLRKELDRRLEQAGHQFEWADIQRDLKALQEVTVEESGRTLAVRTACVGSCGKVFQAVGVAMPPTIREV
ncbi:MAG: IS1634 family transposase [Desulfobulbaceae bacterium]|jgi:transposase|nr:IS1634 family transposase [Desulfobulbaceae bacterium]